MPNDIDRWHYCLWYASLMTMVFVVPKQTWEILDVINKKCRIVRCHSCSLVHVKAISSILMKKFI